jgi:uncharacterized protein (TIGR00725 family)
MFSERTIGVIGSGIEEHDDLAREVGVLLASLGVNLLTGGGRGVMTSVSRAFTGVPRPRGISIGIIPCRSEAERAMPKDGYPNEFIELPIYTHLPHSGNRGQEDLSRNHIIILSSAAIIALPGSEGTASEMALAVRYGKPMIAFSDASDISGIEEFLRRYV